MIVKLYFHIAAAIRKTIYRVLYRDKVHFGRGTTFRKYLNIYVEAGGRIDIGEDCFFNHGCSIAARQHVSIGNGTLFGENVKIYDHNHRFRDPSTLIKDQGYTQADVHIGEHCWIGSNVCILKGASIGNHCVVGAGCVVDFEVPDDTMVKVSREYELVPIQKPGVAKVE